MPSQSTHISGMYIVLFRKYTQFECWPGNLLSLFSFFIRVVGECWDSNLKWAFDTHLLNNSVQNICPYIRRKLYFNRYVSVLVHHPQGAQAA
jgi:hypothetical protein